MYDLQIEAYYEECSSKKEVLDVVPPFSVIHYIIDGEGYFNGDKLGKNSFFLVNKNHRMCYYPDKDNPWKYIYIRIWGSDAERLLSKSTNHSGELVGTFSDVKRLFSLVNAYNTLCTSHIDNTDLQKACATLFMLINPAGIFKSNPHLPIAESHAVSIKEFIDKNYYKKITMEDIADTFFLSRAYIRNIFVDNFGISPKQYLTDIRIKRACELLHETDMSISIISRSVGYDDSLIFSRFFKMHTGISPTEYRKRGQQNTV